MRTLLALSLMEYPTQMGFVSCHSRRDSGLRHRVAKTPKDHSVRVEAENKDDCEYLVRQTLLEVLGQDLHKYCAWMLENSHQLVHKGWDVPLICPRWEELGFRRAVVTSKDSPGQGNSRHAAPPFLLVAAARAKVCGLPKDDKENFLKATMDSCIYYVRYELWANGIVASV